MIHTLAQWNTYSCICVNRTDYLKFHLLDYIACFGDKIKMIHIKPKTKSYHHHTNPFKHSKIKISKVKLIIIGSTATKYSTLLFGYNLPIQIFLIIENNLFNSSCTSYLCFSKIVFIVQNPIQITLLCKWNRTLYSFVQSFGKHLRVKLLQTGSWLTTEGGYQRSNL